MGECTGETGLVYLKSAPGYGYAIGGVSIYSHCHHQFIGE